MILCTWSLRRRDEIRQEVCKVAFFALNFINYRTSSEESENQLGRFSSFIIREGQDLLFPCNYFPLLPHLTVFTVHPVSRTKW